jgi:hypothetical protein
MSGVFGLTETTTTEVSQLIRSSLHSSKDIVVAHASSLTLQRGMVMAQLTTGKKWCVYSQDAASPVTGSEIPRAILAIDSDVDASVSDQTVRAYFAGEYNADDIVWPDDITDDEKATAMQQLADKGIIIE